MPILGVDPTPVDLHPSSAPVMAVMQANPNTDRRKLNPVQHTMQHAIRKPDPVRHQQSLEGTMQHAYPGLEPPVLDSSARVTGKTTDRLRLGNK